MEVTNDDLLRHTTLSLKLGTRTLLDNWQAIFHADVRRKSESRSGSTDSAVNCASDFQSSKSGSKRGREYKLGLSLGLNFLKCNAAKGLTLYDDEIGPEQMDDICVITMPAMRLRGLRCSNGKSHIVANVRHPDSGDLSVIPRTTPLGRTLGIGWVTNCPSIGRIGWWITALST
ncbi:unnamed protein product [Taenia asiatica]|uniref:DDE_Tnp_1_7 domain-containing protein n=1 Tax=Taenia asiatica TaxID=60517 RepID=A0A0R3VWC0_TAEAS|nr:unnamed protein product [Taenia asiatica]